METDGFRNRQHRFSYLIAIEHAKRIRLDPSLLDAASRFMDRHTNIETDLHTILPLPKRRAVSASQQQVYGFSE